MNATWLMQLWEAGNVRPAWRGIILHQAACGAQDVLTMLDASPGEQARALLQWRIPLFGASMACIADCPACNERLEFDVDSADLLREQGAGMSASIQVDRPPYRITVRAPRLRDIEESQGDEQALFAHCVIEARKGRGSVAAAQLPEDVRARIEEVLTAADPLLDLRLDLSCSSCSHTWRAPFSVLEHCWSDLDHWAKRMLRTVHELASAYGWTENEVLGLSAWRRDRYLQLLGQ